MPGATDDVVLAHACDRNAVLVTFDRDFGELIFRRGRRSPRAVLYLRSIPASAAELTAIISSLLGNETAAKILGQLVVWTRFGTRMRAFPRPN